MRLRGKSLRQVKTVKSLDRRSEKRSMNTNQDPLGDSPVSGLPEFVFICVHSLSVRSRCEGGDDFFKAPITAQRVPKWKQFQLTIAKEARIANCRLKLLAGQILIPRPCGDHRRIRDHNRAVNCIFFYRKQLDGAPGFSQRFNFAPKSSVDQPKHAQRGTVVWLSLDFFLLFGPCNCKSGSRLLFVLHHQSDHAFYERTI